MYCRFMNKLGIPKIFLLYNKILYFKCSIVEHSEELWQGGGWVRGRSPCPEPDDWACSAHQRNEAQAWACSPSPRNPEYTGGVWGRGSHHPWGTCLRGQSSLHCVYVCVCVYMLGIKCVASLGGMVDILILILL